MDKPKDKQVTAAQRKRFRLAMYSWGVEIVLGAALAFLGPKYLGVDRTTAQIVGGLFVVLSPLSFWIGYALSRAPDDEKGSGQVTRMRDEATLPLFGPRCCTVDCAVSRG